MNVYLLVAASFQLAGDGTGKLKTRLHIRDYGPEKEKMMQTWTTIAHQLNAVVTRNLRTIEMVGVLMRIFSFSLVSWLGPQSPFLFVWAFNTLDAVLLSWCAIIKKDMAYTVLNVFWVGAGVVGMVRASGFTNP